MVIIRRLIFIIVLLGLAFVFYRFINPDGANNLIARLRGVQMEKTISNIQDQVLISTGDNLTGEISTGTTSSGNIQTGIIKTGKVLTGLVQTGKVETGAKSSGENLGVIDNMDGFSEVLDSQASSKIIKGNLNYQNSDYKFSITFPGSRDGYNIEIFTGKEIKAQFVFSLDKKDYFILYIISNTYYSAHKSSELSYLTYLTQDSNNTFAYKILENSDSKSKAIPYILRTFKIQNPASNISNTTPNITNSISNTTTKKTTTNSNGNYLKNIFDSFVK